MSHDWLTALKEDLRRAGAVRTRQSQGSHALWRFPDGFTLPLIEMVRTKDSGGYRQAIIAKVKRAIREHGAPEAPPAPNASAKPIGMRPSEVDSWQPHEHSDPPCTDVQPPPTEVPMPDTAPPTVTVTTTTGFVCTDCMRGFADLRALKAHARSHNPPQECDQCHETFANLAQHRTLSHGHTPMSRKAKTRTTRTPVSREAAHAIVSEILQDHPAPIPTDALDVLYKAVANLRGAFVRMEEENKMLRRDLAKANGMIERARNLWGSRE